MYAMNASFRVALSGDFRKADGSAVYPDFDLKPLLGTPGVEMAYLDNANLCAAAISKNSTHLSCWLTGLRPKAHPKTVG